VGSEKEVLSVDCSELDEIVPTVELVEMINSRITDPEYFQEEYGGRAPENLDSLVNTISQGSDRYDDTVESDSFGTHNIGALEALIETELLYECRNHDDLAYLSAFLMHRITSLHPFEEGNKRTAFVVGSLVLLNQQARHGVRPATILALDDPLLNALEDIAMDDSSLSPEMLSRIFRKPVANGISDAISS
jgi:hypothetical protein